MACRPELYVFAKAALRSDDSKEKRQIGTLWEERSGGKGLFLMAEKRDAQGRDVHRQLAEKVGRP